MAVLQARFQGLSKCKDVREIKNAKIDKGNPIARPLGLRRSPARLTDRRPLSVDSRVRG
jgi:hypothetical protein